LTRYPAEVKAELLLLVTRTRERTGWTVRRILHHLGLSKAPYRDWVQRAAADVLADRRPIAPSRDSILGEERSAVLIAGSEARALAPRQQSPRVPTSDGTRT
jgi:transposase-like protein